MIIKTAIVQFCPVLGPPESNIELIKGLLDSIGRADLIILPELASTGYNFSSFQEAFQWSEELKNSLFIKFLTRQAESKNAIIVSGINERDQDLLYNTAVVVGKDGLIGKYRKIHLFMNEKDIFKPGNTGLPVFDMGLYKIGALICFDYLFPESWRILAMKGADIICHPSNLLTQNAHRVVPALSIINRIFIATANRTGSEHGLNFNGQSFITDPFGNVLEMASPSESQAILKDIDITLARDKMITSRNHVFNDRRPESYIA